MLTAVMRFSDRQILASNASSAVPTSPPISLANVICYFVNNKDENPRSCVFEVNEDKQDTEVFFWLFFIISQDDKATQGRVEIYLVT